MILIQQIHPMENRLSIFWDEMHFDKLPRGKSLRDKNRIKNYFSEKRFVASGLRTIFLSENPNEICDKLRLLLQEKQTGNNSDIINQEIVAIIDKLLEYKCITATQHKKILKKFNLIKHIIFELS